MELNQYLAFESRRAVLMTESGRVVRHALRNSAPQGLRTGRGPATASRARDLDAEVFLPRLLSWPTTGSW